MAKVDFQSCLKRFINRAPKVLILNFLWIIFSLPVVTLGASTCAAFYVALKIADDEEGNIFQNFWKGFKSNLKQGTILWCFTIPCGYALYLIWHDIIGSGDANLFVKFGAVVFSLIVISVFLYSYPMIARYENSLRKIVKNSIGFCLMYFWKTVLVVVLVAVEIIVFSLGKWTLFTAILMGPGVVIYTIARVSKTIFRKLEG